MLQCFYLENLKIIVEIRSFFQTILTFYGIVNVQLQFKVIPQFCIAHPFCAYFNNKSLRNIFKMAAI